MNNHEYTQFLLRNLGLCLILIFCQKPLPAFFVIAGNIIGVVNGQFLGDLIQTENIKKITDTMNPQQIYELHNNPGVPLWLLVIVLFLILGLITDLFFNKFHKKGYHTIINSDARVIPSLSMCFSILSQTHRQYPFVH